MKPLTRVIVGLWAQRPVDGDHNLETARAAAPKGLTGFARPNWLGDRAEADHVQAQAQRGAQ